MQIKLEDVFYKYAKKEDYILKNINLEIKQDITVVLGENGSGKSTLVNLINLIYKPNKGIVVIDNNIIKNKTIKYKKAIETVYQFSNMQLFNIEVIDDLLYSVKVNNMDIKKAKEKINYYLELFRLDKSILTKSSFKISGGEKKKIAIISALLMNPKLLILDEPTIGLDAKSKKDILNFIKKLKNDIKIIIILHDYDEIYNLADNIIELKDNQIVNNLTKEEFFDLKYNENKIEQLPINYQIFKYLNLNKDQYIKLNTTEKILNFIKGKNELH